MAAQLKKVKVVIKVQCGEDGRVFGSVTGKDISEALQTQYKFKLDKKTSVSKARSKLQANTMSKSGYTRTSPAQYTFPSFRNNKEGPRRRSLFL